LVLTEISIAAGEIAATLAQKPANIGNLAIQGLVDLKAGKSQDPVVTLVLS
jgi:hypothetical protein